MTFSLRNFFILVLILFSISFYFLCSSSIALSAPLRDGFDEHQIEVRLDLKERRISGRDTITFAGANSGHYHLLIDAKMRIKRILLSGNSTPIPFTSRIDYKTRLDTVVKELIILVPANLSRVELSIEYEGELSSIQSARKQTERGVSFAGISVIGEEGAFFPASSFWFPRRSSHFSLYDIVVSLPLGFQAVMEGEQLEFKQTGSRNVVHYKTNTPNEGINLVASRFVVNTERYKGIDIYTYFYIDDAKLSRTYIDKTKFYIDAYAKLFLPYPYKKFAIVESFLPTGFGMPSFTLLGSAVLRLPFIPDTALGHEFAHNWWGNGVFIDYSKGNWVEALTTYTADHLFKESEGLKVAAAYRKKALTEYANYAAESERSVSSFRFGTSTEARAIGYSKAMMVFHMLRRLVGDELFYASLRKFYIENLFTRSSWEDIRLVFEEVCERDLSWFFDQWLTRAGGPKLKMEEPVISNMLSSLSTSTPAYRLSFTLSQGIPTYRLTVPLVIETETGKVKREIFISEEVKRVSLELTQRPLSIEVDPESDIFRILSKREIAPSLASILGSKESKLILPEDVQSREKYLGIARKIQQDFSLSIASEALILEEDLFENGPSYFIFGGPGESALFDKVKEMLPEELVIEDGYFLVENERYDLSDSVLVVALNAGDSGRTVAILFGALSSLELVNIGARISHLAGKGFLVFKRGGGLKYGTFRGERSLRYEFTQ